MKQYMNFEQLFNIYNIIFFLFLVLIIYLVYTDDRFKLNRKFIFLSIVVVLFLISYYLDKVPYLIIKDLFWYSLVLNGSFVFHVLILSRIFRFCWKKHYEYLGFIISRISFTLSLWSILYLLQIIYQKLQYFWLYYTFEYEGKLGNCISIFIEFIQSIINIIRIILVHFSIIFHNYSLLIIGKNINNFNVKSLIENIIIFLIFFIIAFLIGVPRLYVIWIFQGLVEIYKILNREYSSDLINFNKLNIIEKIKYSCKEYETTPYLYNCFSTKIRILSQIYEDIYHIFFLFDLFKFIITPNESYLWCNVPKEDNSEYPIEKVYKFYPWEDLAFGYCRLDKNNREFNVVKRNSFIYWTKLINRGYPLFKKVYPEIDEDYYNKVEKIS